MQPVNFLFKSCLTLLSLLLILLFQNLEENILQNKNERLLNNSEAISGVLLAVDAATSSANTRLNENIPQFNSDVGLKAEIFIDLVQGFYATLVSSIYSEVAQQLGENIIYVASTKKIMSFSAENVATLEEQKSLLQDVVQVNITVTIVEVQTEIIEKYGNVEITEDDIEKLVFPLPQLNVTEPETLDSKLEIMTQTLKDLLANLNGLQLMIKAIDAALISTSLTGN